MPRVYNRRSTLAGLWLGGLWVLSACGGPGSASSLPPLATSAATAGPAATRPSAATTAPLIPTATAEPLAAVVNGQPLALAAYRAEVRRCQAEIAYADCPARVLQSLIEQVLSEQAAAGAGLTVADADVTAAVQQVQASLGEADAYQKWLDANGYTAETFAAALRREQLRARWAEQVMAVVGETADQVHAQIILTADEAAAASVLAKLQAGVDFATLALNNSLDLSSRVAGGDLGWFPRGWLTEPAVEAAAFALQPGQTAPVVAGKLGYYVVRVLERDPARALLPAQRQALRERAWQAWLEQALTQAVIERRVTP